MNITMFKTLPSTIALIATVFFTLYAEVSYAAPAQKVIVRTNSISIIDAGRIAPDPKAISEKQSKKNTLTQSEHRLIEFHPDLEEEGQTYYELTR